MTELAAVTNVSGDLERQMVSRWGTRPESEVTPSWRPVTVYFSFILTQPRLKGTPKPGRVGCRQESPREAPSPWSEQRRGLLGSGDPGYSSGLSPSSPRQSCSEDISVAVGWAPTALLERKPHRGLEGRGGYRDCAVP